MAPSKRDDDSSEESSEEESSPPAIARKGKFDDEEDSDVLESWDAAEDSEVEREKAKKLADADAKASAEAAANKKSKAQRIEERRMANMRKKMEDAESSSESEDISTVRAKARQREQDADLKHAEDLVGTAGSNKTRSNNKAMVILDSSSPGNAVDLVSLPIFNPTTKDQFAKMKDCLAPLFAANSKKAHYSIFMQDFSKLTTKDLPSEQIKKIASGLTTLANEKMKEEKASDKGGKKTKAAKNKATLVANRDVSLKADTTSYGDLDDDDFM